MNQSKHYFTLKIVAAVLFIVTAACGGTVTALPTSPSDNIAQTLQASTPLASPTQSISIPTSIPTLTPLSSETPSLPTVTSVPPTSAQAVSNLPTATRISFATGATNSITQGTIHAGQTLYYVVKALKDQPMIVMLDTGDQSAKLSIFGANGVVLLPESQQTSNWQGTLPSTQDYYFRITYFRITGDGSTHDFTLNVNIAARIEFSSGQTETTLSGKTVDGYSVLYVAYALAGQQMDVTINTSPDVAALTIWGFSDGQPYARAQNGITNFSMALPSTQDYIIQVVSQGGHVVSYEVTVKIQ